MLYSIYTTIVREKFTVGNFHVIKVHSKIFSSSWIVDEKFLTMNIALITILFSRDLA